MIVAASPTSWGVDYADGPDNPHWSGVLDGIAAAGFRALELGPVGYLPEDPDLLRAELHARSLVAAGTFVFEALHEPSQVDRILALAERASRLVAAAGGSYLVIIDHIVPERAATAGDSHRARRLEAEGFTGLVTAVRAVAEIAADHELRPVFHPHVATYVEFEDETERLLQALPQETLGLCLDTGHSLYAGIDPCNYLLRWRERVECIHLKDVDPTVRAGALAHSVQFDDAVAASIFCPLGSGSLDLGALTQVLHEIRFDGYVTVEQDRDPRAQRTAGDDARASLAALRHAGITDEEKSHQR